jgi:predicted DNA-binding protein YlxM (UPF0122 family)
MTTKREYYLNLRSRGYSQDDARLELAGDMLLYKAGVMQERGKRRGFYTEWQESRRKGRGNVSLGDCDTGRMPDCDYTQDLAVYELRELTALADKWCTAVQSDYLILICNEGLSFAEIGRLCGVDWWVVRDEVRRAAKVIAANEPYWGLYEIIAKACGVSVGQAKDIVKRVQ